MLNLNPTEQANVSPSSSHSRYVSRWMLAFVGLAVLWRLVRYALAFPVWGDEAAVMFNVVQRHDWRDLFRPLDYFQVAPVGFLLAQWTAVRTWGTSEYALRLVPLLSSLAAVMIFARFARRALSPRAAVLAVAILLSSQYVTRYSMETKPYGTDLLVSTTLLWFYFEYRQAAQKTRWLFGLIAILPLAIFMSFPAVFVAAAIALGLLPVFPSRRSAWEWMTWAVFSIVLAAAFFGSLKLTVHDQYDSSRASMIEYWKRGLPPDHWIKFPLWLADVHTAEMFSYPFGGKNAASSLTSLLFVVGVLAMFNSPRRRELLVLLACFGFTLIAAMLRRYPYGGSARIAQHLAPVICLLAGLGVDSVLKVLVSSARQQAWMRGILLVLLVIQIGSMVRDVIHPYQSPWDRDIRKTFAASQQAMSPGAKVWLMQDKATLDWGVLWYLRVCVGWDESRIVNPGQDQHDDKLEFWTLNCDARQDAAGVAGSNFCEANSPPTAVNRDHKALANLIVSMQKWVRR